MTAGTRDRRAGRLFAGWVGRVIGGAAFVVAFGCLSLPFLMGAPLAPNPTSTVAPSISYSGLDLTFGGTADVLVPIPSDDGTSYRPTLVTDLAMYGHPQPPLGGNRYGILAVACIVVGALASLIPSTRWRATVASAAGLLGALALLALQASDRPEVAHMLVLLLGPILWIGVTDPLPVQFVSLRYGFYLAITVLTALGMANVVAAVPARTATLTTQTWDLEIPTA